MEEFREVLLDVWREACRHIEIQESTEGITRLLGRQFPLEWLVVRRFDGTNRQIVTVGAGHVAGDRLHAAAKSSATEGRWKRLMAWASLGEILRAPANRRSGDLALVVPPELDQDVLAGPLTGPDGPAGALIAVAPFGQTFRPANEAMLRALLEPFSAALENDRRLHELASLREAAEADRRSLLSRLGRRELNEAIVGAETGLKLVMERVELVASSDVPVLILGETGTGKEVVSRAIHTRSSHRTGPFIRVNCGAIPPELVDSQLFGHERGSFTGAVESRQGWFERANGGTLFLDEMGELPLPAQVRLLRVLQDGYIERIGGQHPIRVDVRIIAATHRDLASMVKAGTFREDLWYRINVFPILLPRLRERREDIAALAPHFAQKAAIRFGLTYVEPTPEDLALLRNYDWPGNIRELGAVIDRAVILGGGRRLDIATSLGFSQPPNPSASGNGTPFPTASSDSAQTLVPRDPSSLSAPLQPNSSDLTAPRSRESPSELNADGKFPTLDDAARCHIERALQTTHGRIEGRRGAAALLGINPHTLRARMRKLRIDWERFRS